MKVKIVAANRDRDRDLISFILSCCAFDGAGKTRFGLTAPPPLDIVTCDPNTAAVVDIAVKEGWLHPDDYTLYDVPFPTIAFSGQDDVEADAYDAWQDMIDHLRPIVTGKAKRMPRTVVFDTASELSTLNILAEFGKTDKISPETRKNMMGPVYRRWEGMVTALGRAGVNVVLLHRLRELYQDVTERGQRGAKAIREKVTTPFAGERIGFNRTGNITSAEVYLWFDPNYKGELVDKFGMKIVRTTLRPAMIGTEYWGEIEIGKRWVHQASFPFLATILYPQTTIAEWE